jgi:hypothetical protein
MVDIVRIRELLEAKRASAPAKFDPVIEEAQSLVTCSCGSPTRSSVGLSC